MGRSRRANSAPPVSLFSFQDILTSVMGILIFVTLMLALEMTHAMNPAQTAAQTPEQAASPVPDEAQLRRLTQEQKELQARLDALLNQAQEKLSDVTLQSAAPPPPSDAAQTLKPKIDESMERFREKAAKLRELAEKVKKQADPSSVKSETEDLRALLAKNRSLDEKIKTTERELEEARMNPRLSYILQGDNRRSPILIEVSADRLVIGTPSDSDRTLVLPADKADADTIRKFLANLDKRRVFIVLLTKPSGFKQSRSLAVQIREAGFDIGRDLIDENQQVLFVPEDKP